MNDPEQTKEDADTAFRAGQLDDARRLYKEAIATRPGWTAAHNNLAMLLRQSGDVQGAEDHFRLALAADPDQAGILSNPGALLVEQGRLQDSEAYLQRAVELAPKHAGARFASRHSVTHLTAVGHPELIASDADDYMRCAVDLAEDEPRRQTLKESLREQMRLSPVCNGASFTRALENAYRIMWRRYCAGDAPAPIAESDLI
jgi:tetratricopeptide (TPR) repeat protein